MDYINTREIADNWNISERRVRFYCSEGKIPGAKRVGRQWLIPSDAERPTDGRTHPGKTQIAPDVYHFPLMIFSDDFTNSQNLDEDYLTLFRSELDYLEGNFASSLKTCSILIDSRPSPYVCIGCYAVMCYASILMGLHTEYRYYMSKLEEYGDLGLPYREDYNLLVASVRYHVKWDSAPLRAINPHKLSSQALRYHSYTLLMATVIEKNCDSDLTILLYENIARDTKLSGILPACLAINILLSSLYEIRGMLDLSTQCMKRACDIAIENNWINYLSKFYLPSKSLIDDYLTDRHPEYIKVLSDTAKRNIRNVGLLNDKAVGQLSQSRIPIEYIEFILLLSYELTLKDISIILRLSEDDIQHTIEYLCDLLTLADEQALRKYALKIFMIP